MWPMLVDMCKDECKRMLRRIELEAYSNIVTAFRAQGDLSKDKKKVLQDLCSILSISTERHRAEVRRAYNDERLATIADQITGSSYSSEWAIEGRRLIPLMPRLVPQTAFTGVANKLANITASQNAALLPSASTSIKRAECGLTTPGTNTSNLHSVAGLQTLASNPPTKSSAERNISVIPPISNVCSNATVAVHVKGNVTENGNEDNGNSRKRKRAVTLAAAGSTSSPVKIPPGTSAAKNVSAFAKTATLMPASNSIRTVSVPIGTNPVKITLTSPSQKSTTAVTTAPSQKVILVSTSCSSLSSSILQRSVSVPIVRTVTATGTTPSVTSSSTSNIQQTKTSTILSSPIMHSPVSVTYTVGSSVASVTTAGSDRDNDGIFSRVIARSTSPGVTTTPATSTISGNANGHKSRAASTLVTKSKVKQVTSAQSVVPLTSSLPIQGINAKPTTSVSKTGILVKPEGAVKIASQTVSTCNTKVSPKSSSSSSSTVMVVTKTLASSSLTSTQTYGPRVVNVISHSSPACTSVSVSKMGTVSSSTGPIGTKVIKTAVIKRTNPGTITQASNAATQTSKPNTIVIQNAHFLNSQVSNAAVVLTATPQVASKDTEAVSTIQENTENSVCAIASSSMSKNGTTYEKREQDPTSICQQNLKDTVATSEDVLSGRTNTVLADLLQAAGILPESSPVPSAETVSLEAQETGVTTVANAELSTDWIKPTPETVPIVSSESSASSSINPILEDTKCSPVEKLTEQENFPLASEQQQLVQMGQVTLAECPDQQDQPLKDNTTLELSSKEVLCETSAATTEEVVASLTSDLVYSKETDCISGREVLGELDPKTGIFYPYMSAPASTSSSASPPKIEPAKANKSIDIFSTALATAQLDLNPFKFPEDTETKVKQPQLPEMESSQQVDEVDLPKSDPPIIETNSEKKTVDEEIKQPESPCLVVLDLSSEDTENKLDKTTEDVVVPVVEPQCEEKQQVIVADDDVVTIKTEANIISEQFVEKDSLVIEECTVEEMSSELTNVPNTEMLLVSDIDAGNDVMVNSRVVCPPTATDQELMVTEEVVDELVVEESGVVKADTESDSATASQSGESTIGLTVGEESGETDAKRPRRKRRSHCVSSMDESLSVPHLSGWARSAMGLLLRVGKFRGAGRKPTDPGAAHWFLQPVTPEEAPGYYDIIKNPMDFSSIKKKLESSKYQDVSEFHSDMILVKENCELYNPADHLARKDCEEVFAFYQQEYNRLVEKWQKSHLFTPSPKKLKTT